MKEFERIEKIFRPLSEKFVGALGLRDDAAVVDLGGALDMVITSDTCVEGIHFLSDMSPDIIAKRALRVNISDLAAMGAKPMGYMLSLTLPSSLSDDWLMTFSKGLEEDQKLFGLSLLGGDTVSAPGAMVISISAFGYVSSGSETRRSNAREGDRIYVTGTIGDSYLGLQILKGKYKQLSQNHKNFLIDRYYLPKPRMEAALGLRDHAHAVIDISDGLVSDLTHICRNSGYLTGFVQLDKIPFSTAAKTLLDSLDEKARQKLLIDMITAGDDYELLYSIPPGGETFPTFLGLLSELGLTQIGHMGLMISNSPKEKERFDQKLVTVLDEKGQTLKIEKMGFEHEW